MKGTEKQINWATEIRANVVKTFEDAIVDCGKEVEQERTTYPGTARSQAIKDYNAYVKSHPGILAYLEIEKSQWER